MSDADSNLVIGGPEWEAQDDPATLPGPNDDWLLMDRRTHGFHVFLAYVACIGSFLLGCIVGRA